MDPQTPQRRGGGGIPGYGAGPVHLIALLGGFALSAYAATELFAGRTVRVVVWFAGSAILHDVLLVGLYGTALVGLITLARRHPGPLPWVYHVVFPGAGSALLLLVWWPTITQRSDGYLAITSLTYTNYALRWLAVTAVLFAASAVAYTIRLLLLRQRDLERSA